MKKFFICSVAIAVFSSPAVALDTPGGQRAPTRTFTAAPYDWSGFYVGGVIGASNHQHSSSDADTYSYGELVQVAKIGLNAGATVGFNKQFGNLVYGVEADYSLNTGTAKSGGADPYWRVSSKLSAFGTLRGRVGLAVDRTVLFVTAGAAYGRTDSKTCYYSACPGYSANNTVEITNGGGGKWGWIAGVGVEQAVTDNLSVKFEALYADTGYRYKPNASDPTNYALRFTDSAAIVRFGLNYKFGGRVVAN